MQTIQTLTTTVLNERRHAGREIVRRFLADEFGATSIVDLMLMGAIVGLGCLVGLATIRDQIVFHFNDAALALRSLNQSYSVTVGATTYSFVDPGPFPAPSSIAIVDADPE
jgi:hypothetical protein